MYAIILFFLIFILILRGYPVAFTLAGVSVLFALTMCIFFPEHMRFADFKLLPSRFMGTINNYVLMAVPLFIFMGIMLEKSGLAESLLETMAILFGKFRGGLAISVIIVGALLAASTGIVGATVVTMGLISLPTMLKRGYKEELATGVVASAGTLGQIIPPSVVLILLADTISSSSRSGVQVDVGSMFRAAILPGILLVLCYILYVFLVSRLKPHWAPTIPEAEIKAFRTKGFSKRFLQAFILPLSLIIAVLGSILAGLASPTEAAAVGAMGAMILTCIERKFSIATLKLVMQETMHLTTMVFFILLGATTFTMVFRMLGGDDYLVEIIRSAELGPMTFLALVMIVLFVAGFFVDFIEIIFIVVPVVTPVFNILEVDMLWVGILMALNLQSSFLTPPFGFSLFYLKGVAPPQVKTSHIYKGIIPYIIIQLLIIALVIIFPGILKIF